MTKHAHIDATLVTAERLMTYDDWTREDERRRAQSKEWCGTDITPPEHVTLQIKYRDGSTFRVAVGWMTRGTRDKRPKFWGWYEGKIRFVDPYAWRLAPHIEAPHDNGAYPFSEEA